MDELGEESTSQLALATERVLSRDTSLLTCPTPRAWASRVFPFATRYFPPSRSSRVFRQASPFLLPCGRCGRSLVLEASNAIHPGPRLDDPATRTQGMSSPSSGHGAVHKLKGNAESYDRGLVHRVRKSSTLSLNVASDILLVSRTWAHSGPMQPR